MKVGIVCSQGGHLTEALEVFEAFDGYATFIATYTGPRHAELQQLTTAYAIDYSGVGPLSALRYAWWALRIMWTERPDVIFSTGAEIALPFFLFGRLTRAKLIYLECWCKVNQLSLTGRLVYRMSNVFLVQWPQLLAACGCKAKYAGAVL